MIRTFYSNRIKILRLKNLILSLLCAGGLAISQLVNAALPPATYPDWPWAVMLYSGQLQETSILNAFTLNAKTGPEIFTAEVSREVPPDNLIRHYLQPVISTMALTANVAYINDPAGPIYEFNPYVQFRWENFPWDRFLVNTYALGWGISYDSRVSTWERQDSNNSKKLLNYLMLETTLALPQVPQLQLVLRLHHRSGAFGLYGADNTSSNFLGVGIRLMF